MFTPTFRLNSLTPSSVWLHLGGADGGNKFPRNVATNFSFTVLTQTTIIWPELSFTVWQLALVLSRGGKWNDKPQDGTARWHVHWLEISKVHRSKTAALLTVNYTDITTDQRSLTLCRVNQPGICDEIRTARRSVSRLLLDTALGCFSNITFFCYMKETFYEQNNKTL